MVQLGALLVACLRVPLAAKSPQPAEVLAAHGVVLAQAVAAALLFPYLLRDRRAALAVVASALPFVALGGVLSGLPVGRVVAAAAYITLWLAALGAVRHAVRPRFHLAAVAIASLVTVGTPLLLYLSVEFGNTDSAAAGTQQVFERWSPISPALAALLHLSKHPNWRHWVMPVALLAVSVATLIRARSSRQVIHKS
jgi:hypothetical protein